MHFGDLELQVGKVRHSLHLAETMCIYVYVNVKIRLRVFALNASYFPVFIFGLWTRACRHQKSTDIPHGFHFTKFTNLGGQAHALGRTSFSTECE